jgi:hypothetical protein
MAIEDTQAPVTPGPTRGIRQDGLFVQAAPVTS